MAIILDLQTIEFTSSTDMRPWSALSIAPVWVGTVVGAGKPDTGTILLTSIPKPRWRIRPDIDYRRS